MKITATIIMKPISKELREEYLKAVREYRYYRTMRQATLDVLKKGTSLKVPTNYTKLNIDTLYKQGTYRIRKLKDKTYKRIQYKGINAIKLQLKSLKRQTSAEYRKNIFIENYLKSMKNIGYTKDDRDKVEKKLKMMSSQRLYLAIDSSEFPTIDYNYANNGNIPIQTLLNKIDVSTTKITQNQREAIKKRYKALLPQFKQDIKGI